MQLPRASLPHPSATPHHSEHGFVGIACIKHSEAVSVHTAAKSEETPQLSHRWPRTRACYRDQTQDIPGHPTTVLYRVIENVKGCSSCSVTQACATEQDAGCSFPLLQLSFISFWLLHMSLPRSWPLSIIQIACLSDPTRAAQAAVGDRVTLLLGNGSRRRVKLPFAPAHPLPQLPLDALRCVLKPVAWRALFSAQLMHPGRNLSSICGLWHVPCFQHIMGSACPQGQALRAKQSCHGAAETA